MIIRYKKYKGPYTPGEDGEREFNGEYNMSVVLVFNYCLKLN